MSRARRALAFSVLLVALVGGSATYAARDLDRARTLRVTAPGVAVAEQQAAPDGPFVAFRHTGPDREYGVVATVPLDDPGGSRVFTGATCDRVAATRTRASCLRTERGVVTRSVAEDLDADWQVVDSTPLPGLPSRTRLSPDGALVASTSFVTGQSYAQVGFSTATEIRDRDGTDYGNLETFALTVDGRASSPTDRNMWGVTFADDDDTFWATVATGARRYLVQGDLSERALTTVADDVECPSLSPDGTRIAFKQAGTVDGAPGWTPAVLDLETGVRTILTGETRNLDDQLEWLDDSTLLYGLARPDEAGVTDVWSLNVESDARPELFIEQAWSPSVVR